MSEIPKFIIICEGSAKFPHKLAVVCDVLRASDCIERPVPWKVYLSNRKGKGYTLRDVGTDTILDNSQRVSEGARGVSKFDMEIIECLFVHKRTGQKCSVNYQMKASGARLNFDNRFFDALNVLATRPQKHIKITIREVDTMLRSSNIRG